MDSFSPTTLVDVIVALLVLCLPGTALYMAAAWALGGRDVGARLIAPLRDPWAALLPGIGLSVAFWPLLLLYCSLPGGRFTPTLLWVVLALSLVVIAVLWASVARQTRPSRDGLLTGLILSGMTLLALAFRLGDVNGLAVPMFGDSLHHTMVTSIIVTTGQVPTGYQPYVPVDTFTYHFGFHTLAAVLGILTGQTPVGAVLIMGQVLNVMSLPVAYLFARQLFASRTAGLAAALITGFVSVIPAYYMNWGRYTQLSGMILLPVAAALLLRAVQSATAPGRDESRRYETALAAFCVAGLWVVHYRMLIFYGLFALAIGVWFAVINWTNRRLLLHALGRAAIVVGTGTLLAAPWIWNVVTNYLPGLTRRLGTVSPEYVAGYNSLDNVKYVGLTVAGLGVLGLWVALWLPLARRKPTGYDEGAGIMPRHYAAFGVATWIGLMLVSMWVPPGAIGSLAVALALYMPLSALGGYGVAMLAESARTRLRLPSWSVPIALLIVAPVLAFALRTWHVADPDRNSYVRSADLEAFDWIKANAPSTAKFLISSQISYAGRAVTASDAGMWLPLLADRGVSVPALAAWTEHPLQPDFFTQARTLAAYTQPPNDPEIRQMVAKGYIPAPLKPGDPKMLAQMEKMGITHVYSGTSGGASKPRLDLAAMRRDSCHYKLVRPPKEGVYVFEVNYKCP